MLDPEAIERHLKVCHSHFGEKNVFDSEGNRLEGFFVQMLDEMGEDRAPENVRYFHSPARLAKNARIEDRKTGQTWKVKSVMGEESAFVHTLELVG